LIGFARTHRYTSVFFQFPEVVFNQVPPFVGLLVEFSRIFPVGIWRYNRGDVTRQQVVSQPICVESSVRQKVSGGQALKQGAGFAQVVCLTRHQAEINKVSKCIGQRQYLGGYASARTSNGLAESPPFAPWPERWTLTMVPSIMAYSKSAPSANALNIR